MRYTAARLPVKVWFHRRVRQCRSRVCPRTRWWRSSASQRREDLKEKCGRRLSRLPHRGPKEELEQDASANLEDAVAEGADVGAGDRAEDRRVQGCVRSRQVGEVEDVCRLTAKLEPYSLPDWEVAEDRRVDVAPARSIQRILTRS